MEPITLKPLRKQGRTTGIFHSINKTGSNMNRSVKFFAFLLVAAAMVVSGCGGNVKVKGTVKFANGEPLPGGVVNFTDGQKNYRGEIQTDGTFEMRTFKPGDGVPKGTYQVFLSETLMLGSGGTKTTKSGEDGSDEMSWEVVGKNTTTIDQKYNDPVNSGLKVDVTKSMTYDITLE